MVGKSTFTPTEVRLVAIGFAEIVFDSQHIFMDKSPLDTGEISLPRRLAGARSAKFGHVYRQRRGNDDD